ncbi:MAG: glycosyltransferase [Pedobacter sp.]|uniref:glycosyltransferase n=1 Tax=Pedobacter agri TaxID=454586 RepID=UPI0012092AFF|nr:glycosyltransferase [Pedobacter agri]RZL63385.1 MAG: glycosyltransferase [Pedobacter sp.]
MLENAVVFILSNAKYDAPLESTGYAVAKHLAKKNKVFYIEYPATIKDYFSNRKSPEFIKRKGLYKNSSNGLLKTEYPNLNILITPILLSINFLAEGYLYRKILSYNERLILKRLRKVIKMLGIKDFIFINSFNIHYPNISELLKAKLNVYHCVDPIVQSYDAKHGHISEDIILDHSDIVICTSKELYRNKIIKNPHTYFIPNAADFIHSSKALLDSTNVLPQLKDIKKPIIGYLGNLEARTDFVLLKKLLAMNKDKSFIFVGPASDEALEKISGNIPNLFLVDKVAYKDMPSVLKGFDVAIIPFKKDNVSHTIFPLKLFEYLGSGKPVVSSDFNTDLDEFTNGSVPFCKDANEFTDALNDALLNDTTAKRDFRLEIAKNNTWDRRLDEFSNILQKHYHNQHDQKT